jgi:CRP/FNR family transcriptional regulator
MKNGDKRNQAIDSLASVPYFSGVDNKTLEAIAAVAIRRKYKAGQTVFLEGQPSTGLFVVEEGNLKSVKISTGGREQVIRVVGSGDVFNAIGVLASATNPGTVIALESATVWIIERESLLRLLNKHPALAGMIIQALAARIQRLMKQVEDLSLRSVEGRLARLLIEEASQDVVLRRKWDTQAEMAARLGTVTDVLNRTLRRMGDEGLIEVERDQIRILDKNSLAKLADLEL